MKLDSHERAHFLVDQQLMTQIPAEELNWLERHTQECAACRNYYELSGRIISGLRSLSFEADPKMTTRVMEAIAGHRASGRMSHWLLAAAAVFVMAAIPVFHYAREIQRAREIRTESADALFVESVDTRLSRTVPVAMEPLTGGTR